MAIDSANKRFSMINFVNPVSSPLIIPDGLVGDGDRFHFLNLYFGITLTEIAIIYGHLLYLSKENNVLRLSKENNTKYLSKENNTLRLSK